MQSLFEKQKVLTLIEERIAPFIGKNMARAATRAHCEKLGITNPEITTDELSSLVTRIGQAMLVFVGKAKTERILSEIHRSIGMGGRAS